MENFFIITFSSTHHAISAEQKLLAAGIPVRIIPIPRELTADCGLSLRFETHSSEAIRPLLSGLSYDSIYKVAKQGLSKTISPVCF